MKILFRQTFLTAILTIASLQMAYAEDGTGKDSEAQVTASKSVSVTADEVVRTYSADREHIISSSLSRRDQDKDFAYELIKERQLLEELAKPANHRLRLLLVLHAKSRSIATVAETIANEQVKRDSLSVSFLATYNRQLEQLRQEAAVLERALK